MLILLEYFLIKLICIYKIFMKVNWDFGTMWIGNWMMFFRMIVKFLLVFRIKYKIILNGI